MIRRLLTVSVLISVMVATACGDDDGGASGSPAAGGGSGNATGGRNASSGGRTTTQGGTSGQAVSGAGENSAGTNPGANGDSGNGPGAGGVRGEAGTTAEAGSFSRGGTENGGSAGDNGSSVQGGAIGQAGAPAPACRAYGELCADNSQCCSKTCNPNTNSCESSILECAAAGDACNASTDCCSLSCLDGMCSDDVCVSDGGDCASDAECCGGVCDSGTCSALNQECKTSGNECSTDEECCSNGCTDGHCDISVSWCIQPGDMCQRDQDCCTASCERADGAALGTCAAQPEGPAFCSGGDGIVCDDCGDCCSRLCAPFGPSGRSICQPASGCHVTGDLCRKDSDCCGGDEDSGLPGAGHVTCEIESGKTVGICRNPNSCNPQGNVCHYQHYECSISSARANCCGGLGAKGGVCQLDALGIPRCNGLGEECIVAGERCASSDDCCNDAPCVPDDDGLLRCADVPDDGPNCVMTGSNCTINADCCSGSTCIRAPGSTSGTCGMTDDPGGEGGASGSGGSTGSGGEPPTTSCSEYGQLCDGAADCCNAVPCNGGICRYFTP